MFSDTNIVYFRQSYINALFDGNSQEKLESFLKSNFPKMILLHIVFRILNQLLKKKKEVSTIEDLNIADDLKNIIYIGKRAAGLSVKTKNIKKCRFLLKEKAMIHIYETYYPIMIRSGMNNWKLFLNSLLINWLKILLDITIVFYLKANFRN